MLFKWCILAEFCPKMPNFLWQIAFHSPKCLVYICINALYNDDIATTKVAIMNPLSPTLIFKKTYKVYINHTDAGGIVYHANHLTFFENCRRDWLASMGFDGYFFENDGQKIHFVVSQANVSYRLPFYW